jgi:uncharacterized glyoxalase superfamily protein PhnB
MTSATASVEVCVDPVTAFTAFTDEIGEWWVPGPINFWNSARALTNRIEPGVGGRILEVYDDASGDALEIGRITVWEPGARLAYRSSVDETEVDIRFEAVDGGTRVSVVHSFRPGAEPTQASLFWPNVLHWLVPWCRDRAAGKRSKRRLARLSLALYYTDPPAAARWLARVFGLTSRDRIPAEGAAPDWIELHVGDVAVLLFPLDGKPADDAPVTHMAWVYVDDLDAHYARAEAAGATIVSGIHQHGYRAYVAEDLEGRRWTFAQAMPSSQDVGTTSVSR